MQRKTLAKSSAMMQKRIDRLMFWYSFAMSFPVILIFQNISIYIFPFILLKVYELSGRFISIKHTIQFLVIAFGIGALISTFNISDSLPSNSLMRALEVLPNYLYWVLLILFFTSYSEYVNLEEVYKGIFWGLISSIFFYFFLQGFSVFNSFLFKNLSQNTFAFLLICFSPITVWYAQKRYGLSSSVIILFILAICGFLSGSRSGSLLTLSGGTIALILNRRSIGAVFISSFAIFIVLFFTINSSEVRSIILKLNPRTYELLYESKKTFDQDRSYLTRLAQVEKSLIIFSKFPLSGVGLNNFTNYQVNLPGKFEGAEFVVNKKNIDRKSAHNSYFGFLAEGGLVLIVPFILLLLYIMIWFFSRVNSVLPEYRPIFVGIIHMGIHLYFIYAILNVFAWFLLGLGCMIIVKYKR